MSALRMFARLVTAGTKNTARHLHMTGLAPSSSLLAKDQSSISSSQAQESISITNLTHHLPRTSRFARQFDSSRSLKAIGDSNTVDFTFLPDFNPDVNSSPLEVRVPLLPWAYSSGAKRAVVTETDEPVMLPIIHTVAADGAHVHAPSAINDASNSQHFDYQSMAARVTSKLGGQAEQSASMVEKIWSDFIDDLIPKAGTTKSCNVE